MHKNNIRLLALLLSLAMIVSLACSCNRDNGDNFANNSPSGEGQKMSVDSIQLLDKMDLSYSDRDTDPSYDANSATLITLSGDSATVKGSGAAVNGNAVTISDQGTYILSGSINDGQIKIDADDNDKIQLVLDNASINYQNSASIYINNADKVFITLADNSSNTITDGTQYSQGDSGVDAAIFSRADLTVNGSGALSINANYKHGIQSNDDLIITGGEISITSAGHGILGKDCVKIKDCTLNITSGNDAIQSDNAEDQTLGFVSIDGGTFNLTCANDGIQAETAVRIANGIFNITAGGGSANAVTDEQSEEESSNAKGITSNNIVTVYDGTFNLDCSDDTIHSNGDIQIDNGTITATAGNNGAHADSELLINGGTVTVSNSNEGLEGNTVTINGGTNRITSTDDGINASNPDNTATTGAENGCVISINGGYTVVDALGDGIDSNGNVIITGGVTLITGPANNDNSAFDYETTAEISGGTFIAAGSAGMSTGFSDSSTQCSIKYTFTDMLDSGTSVCLTDESGQVLASFAPIRSYNDVLISAPDMQLDKSYILYTGGTIASANSDGYADSGSVSGGNEVQALTLSDIVTSNSSGMGMGNPGNMGEPPQLPNGEMPQGEPPEMPGGERPELPELDMPEGGLNGNVPQPPAINPKAATGDNMKEA